MRDPGGGPWGLPSRAPTSEWAPGAEGSRPPSPQGLLLVVKTLIIFSHSRRGRPASRPKAPPQLRSKGSPWGMGWLATQGVDGAGEWGRGGDKKEFFTVALISNLSSENLAPLWWPRASMINVTNSLSGGNGTYIKPLLFSSCLNMEFCLQCGPIMRHHFLVNFKIQI